MLRSVSISALLAVLLSLVLAQESSASSDLEPSWSTTATAPSPARVYVIGDSITYAGASRLLAARPGWHVNGVPGRWVQSLGAQVDAVLAADPHPRVIVVALGTNRQAGAPYDYDTVYADALRTVPADTRLILVTPFRDPAIWNSLLKLDPRTWSIHAYRYARGMNAFAAARPHTCLMRWRQRVSRETFRLHDGVHPNPGGRDLWARMLTDSVRSCA